MPIEPGDSTRAKEIGQAGGQRSAQARRRLVLEDVERELPRLTSIEAAKARLEKLSDWGAAGLLAGTVLHGAVRAVEVWLRLHDHELDVGRIKLLEARIAELDAERSERPDWRLP